MTWSVATPTWVAPFSSNDSTDPRTPRVAPSFGSRLFGAKWYRNNSYVPSTRCALTPSPRHQPQHVVGRRRPVVHDLAVAQRDAPVDPFDELRVVGGHDYCDIGRLMHRL